MQVPGVRPAAADRRPLGVGAARVWSRLDPAGLGSDPTETWPTRLDNCRRICYSDNVTAALLSAALDKVKALDALLAECTTSTTTRVVTAALSAAKSELAAVFVDTCVRVA